MSSLFRRTGLLAVVALTTVSALAFSAAEPAIAADSAKEVGKMDSSVAPKAVKKLSSKHHHHHTLSTKGHKHQALSTKHAAKHQPLAARHHHKATATSTKKHKTTVLHGKKHHSKDLSKHTVKPVPAATPSPIEPGNIPASPR